MEQANYTTNLRIEKSDFPKQYLVIHKDSNRVVLTLTFNSHIEKELQYILLNGISVGCSEIDKDSVKLMR